jgi:hypothetical protein
MDGRNRNNRTVITWLFGCWSLENEHFSAKKRVTCDATPRRITPFSRLGRCRIGSRLGTSTQFFGRADPSPVLSLEGGFSGGTTTAAGHTSPLSVQQTGERNAQWRPCTRATPGRAGEKIINGRFSSPLDPGGCLCEIAAPETASGGTRASLLADDDLALDRFDRELD